MKANKDEQIPKENYDYNRDKDERLNSKSNLLDEREHNRFFGKNIQNSQSNSLVGNPLSLIGKFQDKNNIKNKIPTKEKFNVPNNLVLFTQKDESLRNLALLEKNTIKEEDSDSLSQIIVNNNMNSSQELREYKELLLANDNFLQKKSTTPTNVTEDESVVKIGNFFVKKNEKSNTVLNACTNNNIGLNYSYPNKTNNVGSNNTLSTMSSMSESNLTRRKNMMIYLEKSDYDVRHNPQYVVEYINDIFTDLKENENVNSAKYGYLSSMQNEINDKMRAVLIDWIIEVHQKFKLNPETLYLAINLIDRYLAIQMLDRGHLQLLGVGAMLLASKYEEIYPPEIRDFVYITDKTYIKDEIIKMEYTILSGLNFDILQISPYSFLKRFHFITCDGLKSFYLAQFILEFSLLEYKMLLFSSSMKAAACLYIARKILKLESPWPQNLVSASEYQEKDLKPCVKDVCKIIELMPRITLKACILKFSSIRFMEVGKINLFC